MHIGSSHFQREKFTRFLNSLEPGVLLILNGDTLDRTRQSLAPADLEVWRRLLPKTGEFNTVWIEGNHDNAEAMKKKWDLDMHQQYVLENAAGIMILHGVCFDTLGNRLRCVVWLFRVLHRLRIKLGLTSIHIAEYAKHWRCLYRLMCNTVRNNAVRHARAVAVSTVVCGHVHKHEDVTIDRVRYINTGAWTERENYYLEIIGAEVKLRKWE